MFTKHLHQQIRNVSNPGPDARFLLVCDRCGVARWSSSEAIFQDAQAISCTIVAVWSASGVTYSARAARALMGD